ncbi:hypothetical protein AHAS_Ahas19G0303100 [Arachis hypogaea]
MPRVKLAEIVDSDPEDSSNSLGTDSSVNDMDDVPEEYAMGFSESIPQPWVKPSNKRATFVDPPLMKKPFLDPPSSGLLLGMDKTMKPAFDSSDCRVLGEFVEKPSYQRWCSQTHTFLTSWSEFSPTLKDVVVLLQLPVFGSVDLTLLHPDSDLLKLARHLQMSFSDAGRYAKELSKSRQAKKSSSKDEHPKTRQSSRGEEVVGDKQDSKKKKITVKYSYSNWPRYFFGDFLNGEFVPAPAVSSDLREAAFVAYWLSKYVFLGPVDECVSHGVFLLACLISRGERLPLAPMYLDSLYTRLDQFSQQLKIAHGVAPFLTAKLWVTRFGSNPGISS